MSELLCGDEALENMPSDESKRSDFANGLYLIYNMEHLHNSTSAVPNEKINIALQKRIIRTLVKAGRDKDADKMRRCGNVFSLYQDSGSGVVRSIPYNCGHRFCQRCQKRRVGKFWKRIEESFKAMKQPKMLTLTLVNVPQIDSAYFKYVRGCLSKLRRRKAFKQVTGGVYSIETTYNKKRKDWHVHLHCLIDSDDFINRDSLIEAWKKITDGSWCIDIRLADKDALKEVLKYECKLVDFASDVNLVNEYLDAVKNARLFHSFGKVFDFEKDIDAVESIIEKGYLKEFAQRAVDAILEDKPDAKPKKLLELALKKVKAITGENWKFLAKVVCPGDQFTDSSGFVWTWEKAKLAAYGMEI